MQTQHSPEDKSVDHTILDVEFTDSQAHSVRQRISATFTLICSGFALVSDGYQNSVMTMLNVILAIEYPKDYTSAVSTQVSNAILIGDIIGMILIGITCDRLGRKVAIVITTFLIIFGTALAAGSVGPTPAAMFTMLGVARGITGVGVGGEYPASSASASEAGNELVLKQRGPVFIMCTNFVLSFGNPLAVSIFLIVFTAADGPNNLSTIWRTCLGIGVVFPLVVFITRIRMLTSKLYSHGAIKRNVPYWLALRFYWRRLIGTCGSWLLYDIVSFGNGAFSGQIISSLIGSQSSNNIKETAEYQLLLSTIALPGVFVGAALCNRVGRKWVMMTGFSGYIVIGAIIAGTWNQLSTSVAGTVVMYGLLASFGNLGPGNFLGLMSSESYASGVRGQFYGLSAACGKAGAAIGTEIFNPVKNNYGTRYVFVVAACCGVAGVLVVFFFIPNLKGEDLAEEDARFHRYLREHGWNGQYGLRSDEKALIGDSNNSADN